jgi:ElaB/YqjD/DUF883 family membrane-anchored ribosome-binding protein
MARKEINIFSVSFLDLLSGALGAVIILYIIIPKMTASELETIQTLDALKVEAQQVQEMMTQLQSSVDKALYEKLQEQIQSIQNNIEKLTQQVTELSAQLKDAQGKLADCEGKLEELQNVKEELDKLKQQLAECESKLAKCPENYIAYKEWMDNCGLTLDSECPRSSPNVDVGFKFKGKRIVFLIDVSGSMREEDRIGQVKAGLKMLVTTMQPDFSIDMVQYPYYIAEGNVQTHKPFYGSFSPMNDGNKSEIFTYLNKLTPNGGTPTRAVLTFALNNYNGLTDIVLLSDGDPTVDPIHTDPDDINDIVNQITRMNGGRVNINCIGVGNDFIANPSLDKVRFLKMLSEQNNGFFVGF